MTAKLTILGNIEGIQKRPEMYIGDTSNPDHLVFEVLDNALDECSNGYANKISIIIDNDKQFIAICDNGRGIPSHQITIPESNTTVNSIIGICTYTHSGGKFDNAFYKRSIGLHGIGLTAVNALSSSFTISTKTKTHYENYQFVNGAHKQTNKYKIDTVSNIDFSTRVSFSPNKKYFSTIKFDDYKLKEKLILFKSIFPNVSITINNIDIKYISLINYAIGKFNPQKKNRY